MTIKPFFLILVFFLFVCSCSKNESEKGSIGTSANCTDGEFTSFSSLSSFAPRKDNASFPVTVEEFNSFFSATPRVVASLKDELEGNGTFTANHSVIPSPLDDSDGYHGITLTPDQLTEIGRTHSVPPKKHYLETIARLDSTATITSRANIIPCGATGTVSQRISECLTLNGRWSYYDGKKYGQDSEGDWKLVTVLEDQGTKYEVWRDERTKLLWSDSTLRSYGWMQAAGYSKPSSVSVVEIGVDASPGSGIANGQPANPESICPDVITSGEIVAGGGTPGYTYVNLEAQIKGGLRYPQVTWRLPSINDWKLADVNGIRKVLPNMEIYNDKDDIYAETSFWSSTLVSQRNFSYSHAWEFYGGGGMVTWGIDDYIPRGQKRVRCVGPARD